MNPISAVDWTGSWRLDPGRTVVGFRSPTFWGLAHVSGRYTDVTGAGEAGGTGPDGATGHLDVATGSVTTGMRKRDEHLRSADFFDVEQFPTARVDVESVSASGAATVDLRVRVAVKDRTLTLTLPGTVTALNDGALRVVVGGRVSRRALGVDGNLLGMMGDTATVEATAVFVKQS
jgi:polyisoprenoid-binding protein YceI